MFHVYTNCDKAEVALLISEQTDIQEAQHNIINQLDVIDIYTVLSLPSPENTSFWSGQVQERWRQEAH